MLPQLPNKQVKAAARSVMAGALVSTLAALSMAAAHADEP